MTKPPRLLAPEHVIHTPAPAVDRSTFNYGRALGRPKHDPIYDELTDPWERRDAAARYDAIEAYARHIGKIAMTFSSAAWALDMALKHVRDAETPGEQAAAMIQADRTYASLDAALEAVGDVVKYIRYGRTGTSAFAPVSAAAARGVDGA